MNTLKINLSRTKGLLIGTTFGNLVGEKMLL